MSLTRPLPFASRYTVARNLTMTSRYIVAAVAKAIGVPIVASCGIAVPPPGFSRLANCALRLDDFDLFGPLGNCTLSGKCLTAQAPQCCSPIDTPSPRDTCSLGYQCGANPIPNDNRLCNTVSCPFPLTVNLVDSQFLQCGSFWQYRDPTTLHPLYMFQEFEFSPSSTEQWYGPTVESFYDSYNGHFNNRVRAIGDRNLVLTIRAPLVKSTLSGALVTAVPFPTDHRTNIGHPYHLVTAVPSDRLSLSGKALRDFLYSPSTQLALVFDRILSTPHFRNNLSLPQSVRTEMGTIQWCIGVSNTTSLLVIEPCVNSSFRWYVDPVTNRIHPSRDPYSCITVSASSHGTPVPSAKAMLLPCRPCAIGFESEAPAPRIGTSIVRAHVDSSSHNITHVSSLHFSSIAYSINSGRGDTYFMGTTLDGDNFGVLINATDGRCLHLGIDSTTLNWSPRCVFGTNTSLLSKAGVFQLPSTGGLGSFLHGVAWDPPSTCVCSTAACPRNVTLRSTDGTGHGALVTIRSADDVTVIHHGIGYRSLSRIETNDTIPCFGHPLTVRVLIQPQSSDDFDIEVSNLELVNVTQYTSRFGRGVIATSDPPPAHMNGLLEIGIAVVGVLCLAALMLNIVLIAYRWKLTETIVREAQEYSKK